MVLAYIDCFGGLSATTLFEALVSVGLSRKQVEKALAGLPGNHNIGEGDGHAMPPDLAEFRAAVLNSNLPPIVKQTTNAILKRLGEAEAAVHKEEELSALQVTGWQEWDVNELKAAVGVVLGLSLMRIARVECSPLRVGGWQTSVAGGQSAAHRLTFSPITAEILCGSSIPVYGSEHGGENVTPVGAIIVSTLASSFGPLPSMTIGGIGYGSEGDRQTRVFIGQPAAISIEVKKTSLSKEKEVVKSQVAGVVASAPQNSHEALNGVVSAGAPQTQAQPSKVSAAERAFVARFGEWITLSITGHQQSGRQRL